MCSRLVAAVRDLATLPVCGIRAHSAGAGAWSLVLGRAPSSRLSVQPLSSAGNLPTWKSPAMSFLAVHALLSLPIFGLALEFSGHSRQHELPHGLELLVQSELRHKRSGASRRSRVPASGVEQGLLLPSAGAGLGPPTLVARGRQRPPGFTEQGEGPKLPSVPTRPCGRAGGPEG